MESVKHAEQLLAELCRNGDDTLRQEVVDVVLEHCLQHDSITSAFSAWRTSKSLAPLFHEAEMLALKWMEMRGGH